MKKIQDVESHLEEVFSQLSSSEFPGYRIRVSLRDKNQRKKRKTASAENWTPEVGDQILISFEPTTEAPAVKPDPAPLPVVAEQKTDSRTPHSPNAITALVGALHSAESRPGYGFVALKWFRDVVLPAVRPEWAAADTRSAVLREAIERGFVLTCKVPNPKSPAFPVTAVRLNRSLPEIAEILGTPAPTPEEFRPIAIRGEGLSDTVLRERR